MSELRAQRDETLLGCSCLGFGLAAAAARFSQPRIECADFTAYVTSLSAQTFDALLLGAAVTFDLGEGTRSGLGVSDARQKHCERPERARS